ncbi:TIGR01777 family oxidoreductase [Marinigracilibium pacificum]|uniref:TIGR01777 family protein n=1 Tax=Marinigracilibium pacificum TaxID=2729599 RepID=A0A848J681_9BACT|nr:TIGR01777 family oxidoreductase [Marinigracilibium pacificum]NMM49974.1 TIGR01777 family protein [Marinigracilibium pacificum]
MRKIVIAGGTGFLGRLLSKYLYNAGFDVYILTRSVEISDKFKYVYWDGQSLGRWTEILEGAEAVINLCGKSVNCRYNEHNKSLIYTTRIIPTNLLGRAISKCVNPPKVWMNSSSATIYADSYHQANTEDTGIIGEGFSVDVCRKWELEFNSFTLPKTRKVILRTSIVLGKNGGALIPIKTLVKFGLGGKHGSGDQFVSWIHEEDFCRAISFILEHSDLKGVINIAAPCPVTNFELMNTIRGIMKVPFGIPQGEKLLGFGALLIGTETELVLKSRRVVSNKLNYCNFKFKFNNVRHALKDLL